MFTSPIPQEKKPLNLSLQESFEEKFLAVDEYAKISNIYFEVSNPGDIESVPSVQLNVTGMEVPGGPSAYVNSKLKEYLGILEEEADKFTRGTDDFESISQALERCIRKCIQRVEENDVYNTFTFDQGLTLFVYCENGWRRQRFQELSFAPHFYEDLKEHFNIRTGFFEKLQTSLRRVLESHVYKPETPRKLYYWDSPNAELEVSELIYTLYLLTNRVRINESAGGTFAKFKRDFFGLFGLNDKTYNSKIDTIKARKRDEDFVARLSKKLQESRGMPEYDA